VTVVQVICAEQDTAVCSLLKPLGEQVQCSQTTLPTTVPAMAKAFTTQEGQDWQNSSREVSFRPTALQAVWQLQHVLQRLQHRILQKWQTAGTI